MPEEIVPPEATVEQPAPSPQPLPLDGGGAGANIPDPLMPKQEFVRDGNTVKDKPFNPANEDEAFLFGPSNRPDEHVALTRPTKLVPAPRDLEKYLDVFSEAARQPDAPPELLAFVRILNYEMGRG